MAVLIGRRFEEAHRGQVTGVKGVPEVRMVLVVGLIGAANHLNARPHLVLRVRGLR